MRVNLTTAARICGRQKETIVRWQRASEERSTREREQYVHLFRDGECVQLAIPAGQGQTWSVDVDALERVHRARGGIAWYPQLAEIDERVPAQIATELSALRDRCATLESQVAALLRERETLRARLDAYSASTAHVRPAVRSASRALVDMPAPDLLGSDAAPLYAYPAIPDGAETVDAFMRRHGVERAYWKHRLPQMRLLSGGPWLNPRGHSVHYLLDDAGRAHAASLYASSPYWRTCDEPTCDVCAQPPQHEHEYAHDATRSEHAEHGARGTDDADEQTEKVHTLSTPYARAEGM